MSGDIQQLTFLVYIVFIKITLSNSRTSTLWKLNSEKTKIIEASPFHQIASYSGVSSGTQFTIEDDPLFNIITSTEHLGQSWIKQGAQYYCTNCHNIKINTDDKFNNSDPNPVTHTNEATFKDEALDCGKPVNSTNYDHLVGVMHRNQHLNIPESHPFSKKSKNSQEEFDINALERKLKKAKREKPKSVQLYNQIGNFWRIKGDAQKAIECFRRALAVSPYNAEVLLNLARVLFALQYLDDAIYLTQRSLEVQPPDKSAWHQHFTLGEILKAYGHYKEATTHLRHSLKLNPDYIPAQLALHEIENMPSNDLNWYTVIIIVSLVAAVLTVTLTSYNFVEYTETKPQKHFNKAMAMRSLRFGMSQKRSKK